MNKQGWEVKKLGDIICFQNGFAFQSSKFRNNGLAILRIGNIENGMINTEDLIFFHKKDYSANLDNYIVNKDDILIAMSGATTGKVAIFNLDETFYINQRVGKITTSSFINNSYVYYFLQIRKEDTFALASGAAQPNISASEIKNISIFVPPLSTQNKIVKELDTLQAIITKKKAQLVELDNLAQATFYEMFNDLEQNKFNFSKDKLENIFLKITDGTHQTPTYTNDKTTGIKFLSSKDVTTGKINWQNIKYIPEWLHKELSKRLKPQKYDILLAKNGTTGVCALVDTDDIFDIYVSLALLRPKKSFNAIFLVHAINNPETKNQFNAHLKGVGVPNLHLKEIRNTEILTPPLDLQNQFAKRIEAIEKQKALINQSISETQLLFDSAMDNYFN